MTTLLPVMTTPAGSSLLSSDWYRIDIQSLSLYLDTLLVKPGMALLKQLSSLEAYVGLCPTQAQTQHAIKKIKIFLNASQLKQSASGFYRIRSPFDGGVAVHTEEEIFEVIRQLSPAYLIVPSFLWVDAFSSTTIRCIVPENQKMNVEAADTVGTWRACQQKGILVMSESQTWLETEHPMSLALSGLVYNDSGGLWDLKQADMARVFQPLSSRCACEACELGLTVSYFQHLFTQTPGLCQRFLIQHNVANYPSILNF